MVEGLLGFLSVGFVASRAEQGSYVPPMEGRVSVAKLEKLAQEAVRELGSRAWL